MTSSGLMDELRFLQRLIARPRQVGAIAPSGPALARAIAAQVDPLRPGPILELGPGTGSVTQALIARGIAEDRLIAIEFDDDLAPLIEQRFPRIRVVKGDAFRLVSTLGDEFAGKFTAIVSGLPLLNQPVQRRRELIMAALVLLAPGAPFVQFSYGLHPPIPAETGFSVVRAAFVLANLPPARVWVYRRAAAPP